MRSNSEFETNRPNLIRRAAIAALVRRIQVIHRLHRFHKLKNPRSKICENLGNLPFSLSLSNKK